MLYVKIHNNLHFIAALVRFFGNISASEDEIFSLTGPLCVPLHLLCVFMYLCQKSGIVLRGRSRVCERVWGQTQVSAEPWGSEELPTQREGETVTRGVTE